MSGFSFGGLSVLSLESRRAAEMRVLIEKYGGRATVAPSVREVPQEVAARVADFAARLARGEVGRLVCMTGVGTRIFLKDLVRHDPGALDLVRRLRVLARGNKPGLALREFGVPFESVAKPHTWREVEAHLLAAGVRGEAITLLEYGEPMPAPFAEALERAGARIEGVPVYRCALPEDPAPLADAVRRAARGEFDVLLLSSGSQIVNFMALARTLGLEADLRSALAHTVTVSIGPACSEAIGEVRLGIDLEANPHKMGILVRAAAEHAPALRRRKPGRALTARGA